MCYNRLLFFPEDFLIVILLQRKFPICYPDPTESPDLSDVSSVITQLWILVWSLRGAPVAFWSSNWWLVNQFHHPLSVLLSSAKMSNPKKVSILSGSEGCPAGWGTAIVWSKLILKARVLFRYRRQSVDAGLTGRVSTDRRQSNTENGRHEEDASAIQDGVNVLADAGNTIFAKRRIRSWSSF